MSSLSNSSSLSNRSHFPIDRLVSVFVPNKQSSLASSSSLSSSSSSSSSMFTPNFTSYSFLVLHGGRECPSKGALLFRSMDSNARSTRAWNKSKDFTSVVVVLVVAAAVIAAFAVRVASLNSTIIPACLLCCKLEKFEERKDLPCSLFPNAQTTKTRAYVKPTPSQQR